MARRPITPFATLPATPPAHSAPNQALATHLPAGALPPAALPADTAPPSESTPEGAALPHGIAPDNLAALPRGCGVYVFRGEGALPLYIGKSVNLRARVLSHLRSADEAAMLAQSRRVDTYRTAGEIGALLLEAQWVKQHMPLYNIRLRRSRSLVAWQLHPDGASTGQSPQLVDSTRHDFAHTSDLYGLYASRRAAQEDLRALAAEHRLCLVALGLETPLQVFIGHLMPLSAHPMLAAIKYSSLTPLAVRALSCLLPPSLSMTVRTIGVALTGLFTSTVLFVTCPTT